MYLPLPELFLVLQLLRDHRRGHLCLLVAGSLDERQAAVQWLSAVAEDSPYSDPAICIGKKQQHFDYVHFMGSAPSSADLHN